MKIYYSLTLISSAIMLASCANKTSDPKPSIKDNSNRFEVKANTVDYSNLEPEKLLKQIKAHFDLDEYQLAKEKLNYVMTNFPDSLGGTDLHTLKSKIDKKLASELKEKQELARLEQNSRLAVALDKMLVKEDGKYKIYKDLKSPKFDTKECFYAYIKEDIYGPQLFLKVRYIDTQWLNIENYIVNVDQLDYTITGEVQKSETKGKKVYKVETLDIPFEKEEQLNILEAMVTGKEVNALYVGKGAYKKRDISTDQKMAIRNVLDAYVFLKSKKELKTKENLTNK